MCVGDDTVRPHVGRCKLPACCIDCDNGSQQDLLTHSTCTYLANLSIIPSNKPVASLVVALLIPGSTRFRPCLAYGVRQNTRAPTFSRQSPYDLTNLILHIYNQSYMREYNQGSSPSALHELLLLIRLRGINLGKHATAKYGAVTSGVRIPYAGILRLEVGSHLLQEDVRVLHHLLSEMHVVVQF